CRCFIWVSAGSVTSIETLRAGRFITTAQPLRRETGRLTPQRVELATRTLAASLARPLATLLPSPFHYATHSYANNFSRIARSAATCNPGPGAHRGRHFRRIRSTNVPRWGRLPCLERHAV